MNNQDMPVSPLFNQKGVWTRKENKIDDNQVIGETKREKAFWMILSSMMAEVDDSLTYEQVAGFAIEAVNAGFKALESE